MVNLEEYNEITFENIKHIDEDGNEYWEARELMIALEYSKWGNFKKVIDRAIISAKNSGNNSDHWVAKVGKPITTGKGKTEIIDDYYLSRYICYLIVQNADPRKKVVALGQTYFAIQTRKQEITEIEYKQLSEEEKRVYNRKMVKDKNKILYGVAKDAGVVNYGKFTNFGYKGLYSGETMQDIKLRKHLNEKEDILDFMGSEELGANIFRITQTEAKLKKDNVKTENEANDTHYKVGKAVRETIKGLGGTMPEKLPTPEQSYKQLEKEETKKQITNQK